MNYLDFPSQNLPKNKQPNYKKIFWISFFVIILVFLLRVYNTYKTSNYHKLKLAARSLQNIDNKLSQTISLISQIYNTYDNTDNIITKYKSDITQTISSLPYFTKYIPETQQNLYKKLIEVTNYTGDIYNILGESGQKKYLIALMNTSEARPNGGFWGSYMIVNISGGKILDMNIHDSYYPNYIYSGLQITGPSRLDDIYSGGASKVGFVSSNKIGFTDRDGYHIKTLYEKAFTGQTLDGVIFIKSSAVRDILPGRDGKFRERQFVNANIDSINGPQTKNKKQIYINELQTYINTNKQYVAIQFIKNWQKLISNNNVQIYIPYTSIGFRDWLYSNGLSTSYTSDNIYIYHSNTSYNKIDQFINKEVYIDHKSYDRNDVISISTGSHNIHIIYTLNIPNIYKNYIYNLTDKYKIQMTERENHILAMDNQRSNRVIIRLPKNSQLQNITGDILDWKTFETPFAKGVTYNISNDTNHSSKKVKIQIEIN